MNAFICVGKTLRDSCPCVPFHGRGEWAVSIPAGIGPQMSPGPGRGRSAPGSPRGRRDRHCVLLPAPCINVTFIHSFTGCDERKCHPGQVVKEGGAPPPAGGPSLSLVVVQPREHPACGSLTFLRLASQSITLLRDGRFLLSSQAPTGSAGMVSPKAGEGPSCRSPWHWRTSPPPSWESTCGRAGRACGRRGLSGSVQTLRCRSRLGARAGGAVVFVYFFIF